MGDRRKPDTTDMRMWADIEWMATRHVMHEAADWIDWADTEIARLVDVLREADDGMAHVRSPEPINTPDGVLHVCESGGDYWPCWTARVRELLAQHDTQAHQ